MLNPQEELFSPENFYKKLDYEKHLRNFGGIGVVQSITRLWNDVQ